MGAFYRAMLYAAALTILAAFGSGHVSKERLAALARRRGALGMRLCGDVTLMILAVLAAVLCGGFSVKSAGLLCFALGTAVLFLSEYPFVEHGAVPGAVFIAMAGAAYPTAVFCGGLAGLGFAAAAELVLNRVPSDEVRGVLRAICGAAFFLTGTAAAFAG